METCAIIERAATIARDRFELWSAIVRELKVVALAEIGVYKGDFAEHMLRHGPTLEIYYMIDPWRHLQDWNKPANTTDDNFRTIKEIALVRTEFAAGKRVVLQGKTTEVSARLPDGTLDLAYIDGDHSLRGITIDLVRVWAKMKSGGVVGGDDFCRSIWQHPGQFEPTMVFPLAVYFAEAVGSIIYALPFEQFAIVVDRSGKGSFDFRDLTGSYKTTTVRDALGNLDKLHRSHSLPASE